MSPFHYNTIEQTAMAEFKDRGSKFIAYAYPAQSIDHCKKLVAQLKKELVNWGESLLKNSFMKDMHQVV